MTFRELLEMRAEQDGRKAFVYFRDQIIDFVTLDRKVNKAANFFRDLGVKKGDHVCLFLPNCPEFLYLWFGLSKIGALMLPIDTRLRESELAYVINNSDSKLIVLNEALYDVFGFVERNLKGIEKKIWHSEGNSPPENYYYLNTLMESAEENAPPEVNIKDGDPLAILYTSGTTGPPKGAIISQLNYINTGRAWAEVIISYREDDIVFSTLPLSHANAQMLTVMSCLVSGRPYVLGERFSPALYFDQVRQYGATVLHLIGSMVTMLMKEPKKENDSDNPVRIVSCAGTSREIWQNFEKRFNVTLIEGYGLTETGGVCLMNPSDKIKIGSIGKPTKFCDVGIWDENNQEIPVGQNGEIVVKEKTPYSMFLGYYRQPDATEEAWRGGWFHTGDRGYVDEEGYFYFVDRIKDCIRTHGHYVSPLDIEAIVNSHPKVLESAAVGVFSGFGEDEIKIYVIVKPNEKLEFEELIAFCDGRMPYFWVPQYVEFLKELPKGTNRYIQRLELKTKGIGNSWYREEAKNKLIWNEKLM